MTHSATPEPAGAADFDVVIIGGGGHGLSTAYYLAKNHGITSITISQRLALEEFHNQELQLGDSVSDQGWKIRDIHH